MKTLLLLPTYNEKENLPLIVEEILRQNLSLDILVIDDNSPDGTGSIADELKRQHSQIDVLHREKKEGLGKAYVHGFHVALARDYDRIITMDCDFSHNPIYLARMLELSQDYALVLGSRYVRGGGVRGWGILRKIISRGGSIYARLILGMRWHDLTGGFKCYSSQALREIALDKICSHGYSFQIETTYAITKKGYRVKEMPIIFEDRRVGKSKMTFAIAWEAVWMVLRLKYGRKA